MTQDARTLRTTTVEELVARWPQLEALLLRHGIDTCCGGPLALEGAARAHDVSVDLLLAEIADVMGEPALNVAREA